MALYEVNVRKEIDIDNMINFVETNDEFQHTIARGMGLYEASVFVAVARNGLEEMKQALEQQQNQQPPQEEEVEEQVEE